MERETGFEPATFAMATRRSSQLSYSRTYMRKPKEVECIDRCIDLNCQGISMTNPLKFLNSWLGGRSREITFMFSDLLRFFNKTKSVARVSSQKKRQTTVRPLVKNRPASLEQRYRLIEDSAFGDEIFQRLQNRLFTMANQGMTDIRGSKIVYKERGKINPDRPYFYLKPSGTSGLLFERSGPGWIVSRAEKIIDRDLFLRAGEILEHANIFLADDRTPLPRIKSDQMSNELLAYAVYEQKLLKHLGLE